VRVPFSHCQPVGQALSTGNALTGRPPLIRQHHGAVTRWTKSGVVGDRGGPESERSATWAGHLVEWATSHRPLRVPLHDRITAFRVVLSIACDLGNAWCAATPEMAKKHVCDRVDRVPMRFHERQ
jgi:hypothetical protein